MAINKFDKFVTSDYISQYVPFPMQEIYAMAGGMQKKSDETEAGINALEVQMKNLDVLEKDLGKKNEIIDQYKKQLNEQLDKSGGNYINPDTLKFLSKWKTDFALNPQLQGMQKSLANYNTFKNNLDELRKQGKLTDSNYYKQLNTYKNWQGTVGEDGKLNILSLDAVPAYADYNKYISDELAKLKANGSVIKKPDGSYYFVKTSSEGVTEERLEDVLLPMLQGSMGTPEYEQMLRDIGYKQFTGKPNMLGTVSSYLSSLDENIKKTQELLTSGINPSTKKPLTLEEKNALTANLQNLQTNKENSLSSLQQDPEGLYNSVVQKDFMQDMVQRFTNQYSWNKTGLEYSYNPVYHKNQELDIAKQKLELAKEEAARKNRKPGSNGVGTDTPDFIKNVEGQQRPYTDPSRSDIKTLAALQNRFNAQRDAVGGVLINLKNNLQSLVPALKNMDNAQFYKWASEQVKSQGMDLSKMSADDVLKLDPTKFSLNGTAINVDPNIVSGFKSQLLGLVNEQHVLGQQLSSMTSEMANAFGTLSGNQSLKDFITLNEVGKIKLMDDQSIQKMLLSTYGEGGTIVLKDPKTKQEYTMVVNKDNMGAIVSEIKELYSTSMSNEDLVDALDEKSKELDGIVASLNGTKVHDLPFEMIQGVTPDGVRYINGIESLINGDILSQRLTPKNMSTGEVLQVPKTSAEDLSTRKWKLTGYSQLVDPETGKTLVAVTYYDTKKNTPILDKNGLPMTGYVEASKDIEKLLINNQVDPQGIFRNISSSIYKSMVETGNKGPDPSGSYKTYDIESPVNVFGDIVGSIDMNSDGNWVYKDRDGTNPSKDDILRDADYIKNTYESVTGIPLRMEGADNSLMLLSAAIYLKHFSQQQSK